MPIYEYQAKEKGRSCAQCKSRFEVRQSMADEPLKACPKCGAPVERVIASVGISTHGFSKRLLTDKSLKKHGFTKLVNEGGGKFRKI